MYDNVDELLLQVIKPLNILNIYIVANLKGLNFRNSEKSQRSQLDLCVVVFRTRSHACPAVGRLVEHSKRQVRGFVGCHKMLERDQYILVCLAFNHWHTGKPYFLQL